MCGRFTLTAPVDLLREFFPLFEIPTVGPRFNVAPTQTILAVKEDDASAKPQTAVMRWGLIPFWAKDKKIGASLINARADTGAARLCHVARPGRARSRLADRNAAPVFCYGNGDGSREPPG
jgi:putative SOS response-associated peptidase YedK